MKESVAKGDFENLTVEFKPGASPVAHFRAADGSEISKLALQGDMGGAKVLEMFAERGFVPQRKKVQYGEKPKASTEIEGALYELWDAQDQFEGASEFAAGRKDEQGRPARVLTVASRAENDAVKEWLNKERVLGSVWMGASDEGAEGQWRWLTDSNDLFYAGDEAKLFANWAGGEPNNAGSAGEHCAIFLRTGEWNDESCDSKHRVVLKFGEDVRDEAGDAAAGRDEL